MQQQTWAHINRIVQSVLCCAVTGKPIPAIDEFNLNLFHSCQVSAVGFIPSLHVTFESLLAIFSLQLIYVWRLVATCIRMYTGSQYSLTDV